MANTEQELEQRCPSLRVVPMPRDTNAAGDIFGGWIMSHVDIAGAVEAIKIARCRVVTVAVNEFVFHQPVYVGDVVTFYATVERVGTTSLSCYVEVYAERCEKDMQRIKVTEANVTYVAVDKNGRPRAVPK